ncbi:MAG TPA: hypothetical protein VG986_19870 [Pseudolabrys sp.]|nr:hypothetical protein [Pseudolabrys sp.]
MPPRKPPASPLSVPGRERPKGGTFRQRYDALEARRTELVERLRRLGEKGERHPSYKRALTLLNDTFRKSKLAQRLAVLEAATWLIDLLEKLTTSL